MSRLSIPLPETFAFRCELPVRVSDLNYGGHVGNDAILTLMQEARVLYYRHLGFASELQLDGSVGQIIADAAVVYKSEAFLGDVLVIEIAVTEISRASFNLVYRITNRSSGKEVAIGKTGVVCFDYHSRKVVSIPAPVRRALGV
ncbi:MAG: thioesterase [Cyclobacteriaceae bacterium]|nr:MAG: thioesterase [Cyclobacteriaceae bacterium]